MSQLVVIPKTLLGSEIASFSSCPACWQSGFTPNGSLLSPRRGITTAVADEDRRYVVNLWLINNKLNQLIPQQRNKDTRQEDFSSVKCAENVFCQFQGRVFFFFFFGKMCVRALKEVILTDWYPELIYTSITSPSTWSRILMKGLLQTIDLSNDEEEEGAGQTCLFFFHRIFFFCGAGCRLCPSPQFDGLVKVNLWWVALKNALEKGALCNSQLCEE